MTIRRYFHRRMIGTLTPYLKFASVRVRPRMGGDPPEDAGRHETLLPAFQSLGPPAPGAGHAPVQGPADWNLPPSPPQRMGPGPAILGPHPRPRDPPRPAPCGLVRLPPPRHVGRSTPVRERLRLPLGERPSDRDFRRAPGGIVPRRAPSVRPLFPRSQGRGPR